MIIIIGSTAIKYWFPDFKREPKDTDIVTNEDSWIKDYFQENGRKVELLENPILLKYHRDFNVYLSPNMLYTLKVSHLFWDINWDKHLWDATFLKSKGCKLQLDLFYELYDYWNEYHGKNKRSDLKMSAEDFFDNAIKCPYEHDDLHTLIKNPPTFTKILVGEVEVSEHKFDQLSFEEKCDLVTEEVMIMAYERYTHLDYRIAYGRMLKKFLLNHAPLWEAIFIIESYPLLLKPKFNYIKQINDGLKDLKQSTR